MKENLKENPKEKTCPFPAEGCYYKGSANTCTRGEEQCLHPARVNPKHWEEQACKQGVGAKNAVKLCKALEEILAITRTWLSVCKIAPKLTIETISYIAGEVLSSPPRNCDLYDSEEDAWEAYLKLHPNAECPSDKYEMWLFDEAEGGAK